MADQQISRQNRYQTVPVLVEPRSQDSDRPSNHNLPNFLLSVRLKYVKLGYHYLISNAMYLLLVPLIGISFADLLALAARDLAQLWDQLRFNLIATVLCSTLVVFLATLHFMTQPKKVCLVDFACYKPGPAQICNLETFMEQSELTTALTEERGATDQLLAKTGVKAKDVAILVVNCSLFNPAVTVSDDREPLQAPREFVKLQS